MLIICCGIYLVSPRIINTMILQYKQHIQTGDEKERSELTIVDLFHVISNLEIIARACLKMRPQ